MDSIIIQILIGIGFFFFLFDLIFVIIIKRKKHEGVNQNHTNKRSLTLLRILTIFGILSLYSFLCICCIYIFLYDFFKIYLLGFTIGSTFQIIGFFITLIGDILLFISYKELGTSWAYPIDKWGKQVRLVTSGIYSKIRHPIYLSFNILSIGFILLIQDWLLLFLYILGACGLYLQALTEENMLTKHFGEHYLNYMKTTGRFMLNARKK